MPTIGPSIVPPIGVIPPLWGGKNGKVNFSLSAQTSDLFLVLIRHRLILGGKPLEHVDDPRAEFLGAFNGGYPGDLFGHLLAEEAQPLGGLLEQAEGFEVRQWPPQSVCGQ